ncbi:MAG: hypothetical protein CNIPEHKO_03516 [Anaerolineales bacterium]|nr:hypothetical protein [Anaerolineales bacterium]
MLLNPAEPEHLVLLRLLDEVSQSFLELLRAVTRSVDERDANPFERV